jgi:ketosteroid isomerase-like protein
MAASDIEQAIEQFQLASNEYHKGNAEPMIGMFSQREDVSVADPWSPAVCGWNKVVATVRRAASNYRDGEPIDFESIAKVVTPELAFIVENEWSRARVGGTQDLVNVALRATIIFRNEDGDWRIVHRHADPIVTAQAVRSILHKDALHPSQDIPSPSNR